jgi:hypothetical protein
MTTLNEILAERGRDYGEFSGQAHLAQMLDSLFWEHVDMEGAGSDKFDPDMREAIHMIFHKLARIANGDPMFLDNWVDGGGYFELIVRKIRKEKAPIAPKKLDVEKLYKTFDLDPENGDLTWRAREEITSYDKSWNSKYAGRKAGNKMVNGYWRVNVDGEAMKLHRVVFAMHYGKDPGDAMVDHINRNKDDNSPLNLRTSDSSMNGLNAKGRGASGHPGVAWSSDSGKWKVSIKKDGIRRHLGYFDKLEEAIEAREKAFKDLMVLELDGVRPTVV